MLSEEIINELRIFFNSACFGIVCGNVYDLILALRRVIPHAGLAYMAEDTLFWLLVTPASLIAMFSWTKGEIYWYIPFAALVGLLLYKVSLSKGYIKLLSIIIQHLVVNIRKCIHIVSVPVKTMGNALKKGVSATENIIKKFTIIPKLWLTVCIKWFKITLCKHNEDSSCEKKYEK